MKTFKITLYILLIVFTFFQLESYAQDTNFYYFNDVNKKPYSGQLKSTSQDLKSIIVCGKVLNHSSLSREQLEISIAYRDILDGGVILTDTIDSEGNFYFTFSKAYAVQFYVKYSSFLSYYAKPGDSLYLEIDSDCRRVTTKTDKEEYAFYKLSGSANHFNHFYTNFITFCNDSLFKPDVWNAAVLKYEPIEYRVFMESLFKSFDKPIYDFNKMFNVDDEFINWQDNFLKFTLYEDLLRFPMLRCVYIGKQPIPLEDSIALQYYTFIDPSEYRNPKLLGCSKYIEFTREIFNYTVSGFYKENRKLLKAKDSIFLKNKDKLLKEYIVEKSDGITKDVLLAKYYNLYLKNKMIENLYVVYSEDISHEVIKNRVHQIYLREKSLYEDSNTSNIAYLWTEVGNDVFINELIAKYPNKILYIDFWAPWCKPCMIEMPYSQKLAKELLSDSVVFIYLANRCDETNWKRTVSDKNMIGEHILLTDEQYNLLSKKYNIKGIPHYMIISKEGKVYTGITPSPKQKEELLKLFRIK